MRITEGETCELLGTTHLTLSQGPVVSVSKAVWHPEDAQVISTG